MHLLTYSFLYLSLGIRYLSMIVNEVYGLRFNYVFSITRIIKFITHIDYSLHYFALVLFFSNMRGEGSQTM